MTEVQSPAVPALVLRRTYPVPRDRVFAAWTDPALAQKFLCPEDVTIPEIAMDVRVGGAYRIVMLLPEGERMVVRGVYREVRAPERLVMTWRWDEDDPADERDTLISLDFTQRDGGTELVLTHEKFAGVESRARHEHGWTAILEKLDGLRTD
ncbi:MAG: SRPBCC domain-containing protein [Candidatus Tumulicola sp.]